MCILIFSVYYTNFLKINKLQIKQILYNFLNKNNDIRKENGLKEQREIKRGNKSIENPSPTPLTYPILSYPFASIDFKRS